MRGSEDLHLLDSPMPELLRQVTGVKPDRSGSHALLKAAGVRSTQRLALGDIGGGIAALTWPAELVDQAQYLYSGGQAPRMLEAAAGGWGGRGPATSCVLETTRALPPKLHG